MSKRNYIRKSEQRPLQKKTKSMAKTYPKYYSDRVKFFIVIPSERLNEKLKSSLKV